MTPIDQEITQRIIAQFPDAEVRLTDMTGTKDHWEAVIISDAFEGQRPLQRQQNIYAALGELMQGPVHAFTMTTVTRDQAAKRGLI